MTNNSRRSEQMEVPINHQQILQKAIRKAIDGGWSFALLWAAIEPEWEWTVLGGDQAIEIRDPQGRIKHGTNDFWTVDWSTLIFNHDFAKAIWGEEEAGYYVEYTWGENEPIEWLESIDGVSIEVKCWQYHLQRMVIADDPIKYLGENI